MSLIIRSTITVLLTSSFLLLWLWAWRRENKERFAAAANQPLAEDAFPSTTTDNDRRP